MQIYESCKEYKAVTTKASSLQWAFGGIARVSILLSMPLADGFLSSEPGILERDWHGKTLQFCSLSLLLSCEKRALVYLVEKAPMISRDEQYGALEGPC